MPVRDKRAGDQHWVERLLAERWGGALVAVGGVLLDAGRLPALIAGDRQGLATWRCLDAGAAELVTLDALTRGQGIGTALLAALMQRLRTDGVGLLRVTTNDNLDALRFYQRRGFRITAAHPGAVDAARRRKPSIPLIGAYGIPLRDEIELGRDLAGP